MPQAKNPTPKTPYNKRAKPPGSKLPHVPARVITGGKTYKTVPGNKKWKRER